MKNNFLHNHPKLESDLKLDNEHVIVDRKDWDIIQRALMINPSILEEIKYVEDYFEEKEYRMKQELYQNHKQGL